MAHDPFAGGGHNKPLQRDNSTCATDLVATGEAVMRNTFESMNRLMVAQSGKNSMQTLMKNQ